MVCCKGVIFQDHWTVIVCRNWGRLSSWKFCCFNHSTLPSDHHHFCSSGKIFSKCTWWWLYEVVRMPIECVLLLGCVLMHRDYPTLLRCRWRYSTTRRHILTTDRHILRRQNAVILHQSITRGQPTVVTLRLSNTRASDHQLKLTDTTFVPERCQNHRRGRYRRPQTCVVCRRIWRSSSQSLWRKIGRNPATILRRSSLYRNDFHELKPSACIELSKCTAIRLMMPTATTTTIAVMERRRNENGRRPTTSRRTSHQATARENTHQSARQHQRKAEREKQLRPVWATVVIAATRENTAVAEERKNTSQQRQHNAVKSQSSEEMCGSYCEEPATTVFITQTGPRWTVSSPCLCHACCRTDPGPTCRIAPDLATLDKSLVYILKCHPFSSWVSVCCWWWFDWSFARILAPIVTTTSIILSSNKIQNGDILIPANPGPPGKMASNRRERQRERHSSDWVWPTYLFLLLFSTDNYLRLCFHWHLYLSLSWQYYTRTKFCEKEAQEPRKKWLIRVALH